MKKLVWIMVSTAAVLSACSNNQAISETPKTSGTTNESASPPTMNASQEQQPSQNENDSSPVHLSFATYYLSDQMKAAVKKYEMLHPNVDIDLLATPSSGKDLDEVLGYFTTFGTVGINANTVHQQAAWDFLQFLMEDQEQSASVSNTKHGFPINQNAYDLMAQKIANAGKLRTEFDTEVTMKKGMPDQLKSSLMHANHWNFTPSDLDLQEMIYQESESFFSGQKSAEDVARLLQNKVNLMLNE
ncbi:hypothetical protein [Paenibacillus sp. BC26]|uniref:hypothetical protein n=1 Tax=Paenibacillus sp. BC26 TaxID=1881032 RepID=UPI0008DFA4BF|nr:hypothetical protein [Paenibacillus sp. BC26]SFS66026.1 hypothetical protein SAMN05428962_1957 [Paenibacillus sp. BC26]